MKKITVKFEMLSDKGEVIVVERTASALKEDIDLLTEFNVGTGDVEVDLKMLLSKLLVRFVERQAASMISELLTKGTS
jgi:hypothetical protein